MSVINLAISEIRRTIPIEVLEACFGGRTFSRFQTVTSMDEAIRSAVIDRVMMYCNNVGGAQIPIPLSGCEMDTIDVWNSVVRIPKNLTNGRRIVQALNITLHYQNSLTSQHWSSYMQNNSHAQLDAAKMVMNSHMPAPGISSASLSIIGENLLLVHGHGWRTQSSAVTVILENEAEMNNLKPPIYQTFFQMVILACKSHIYNTLNVKLDQGALFGGFNLGKISSIIESYSDAEQMFQDFYKLTWRRAAIYNDPERRRIALRMISAKY